MAPRVFLSDASTGKEWGLASEAGPEEGRDESHLVREEASGSVKGVSFRSSVTKALDRCTVVCVCCVCVCECACACSCLVCCMFMFSLLLFS